MKLKNRVFLGIFTILFALLLLELSTRIIFLEYSRPVIQYDNVLVWTYVHNLRLDTFTTNSFGFRDSNHKLEKSSKRIVFVGDSYTAGVSFPRQMIFPGIIQDKFEDSEILNFGVSAYATDQEYLVLKNHVIRYNPDIMILVVAPNDLRESYVKRLFYIKDNQLILDKNNKAFYLSKIDQFLWNLAIKSQAVYMLQLRLGKNYGSFEYIFNEVTNGVFFKDNKGYNADAILFLKNETYEMRESVKLFTKLIEEINKICIKKNIKLVIVNLPIKMQFDNTMNNNNFDQKKIANILKKITNKNKIYYLDLYPLFKESEDPTSYYISDEFHLNENGHKFVSEEIYKFLIKNKLI